MMRRSVADVLHDVREGRIDSDSAARELAGLGVQEVAAANGVFARVDHGRAARCGFPEVVYGPGKTPEQVARIAAEILSRGPRLLVTRVDAAQADAVRAAVPDAVHHERARAVSVDREPRASPAAAGGRVLVVTAGTADEPVAEEARVTASLMGAAVEHRYDCGVAGLHRILGAIPALREADAVVVAAGMDGALPSVVGGLVDCPVIAVPTSVGYGASFQGIGPLLTMLNACAAGVSVVNIDNGFGAGYQAALIARAAARAAAGARTGTGRSGS
ncbi:MAG: Pyridinium-3,5-biscarboxylic acid mononucleotide synthase [Planctomycetes bacterium]|nr:Pyridinium-3,5-biscarboxylic acid mononucleotide synthase [Planctomycetota bacterium]